MDLLFGGVVGSGKKSADVCALEIENLSTKNGHGLFRPQWRTRALRAGVAMIECMRLLIGEVGMIERERD